VGVPPYSTVGATRTHRYCFGVPNDFVFKAANSVHGAILRLSGGRIGGRGLGMPVLELTTTGRKSGRRHTVLLTSPLQDGDTIVVVASAGGNDQHPAWFLNVQANPDVEVAVAGKPKQRMHARVATPEERTRLWERVTTDHKNYAGYQRKTAREIPLVLLEPSG
jgi:deazaflavin-dependent oxidoreductase (nitroreductase family)